jgi:hypothetical protein
LIVKVQLPLESNAPNPPALIYPKGRIWLMQMPMDELPEDVKRAARKGKAYFNVTVNNHNKLDFGVQAPPQDW